MRSALILQGVSLHDLSERHDPENAIEIMTKPTEDYLLYGQGEITYGKLSTNIKSMEPSYRPGTPYRFREMCSECNSPYYFDC